MTKSRPKKRSVPRKERAGVRAVHANIDAGLYDNVVRLADGRTMRAVIESALSAWCVNMAVSE